MEIPGVHVLMAKPGTNRAGLGICYPAVGRAARYRQRGECVFLSWEGRMLRRVIHLQHEPLLIRYGRPNHKFLHLNK